MNYSMHSVDGKTHFKIVVVWPVMCDLGRDDPAHWRVSATSILAPRRWSRPAILQP